MKIFKKDVSMEVFCLLFSDYVRSFETYKSRLVWDKKRQKVFGFVDPKTLKVVEDEINDFSHLTTIFIQTGG